MDEFDYPGYNNIINNTIHDAEFGIRILGARNNTITNNTIWNTIISAIDTSDAGDLNITNNRIYSRGEPLSIGASGDLIIKDNIIEGWEVGASDNMIRYADSLLFVGNTVKNVDAISTIHIIGTQIINNTFFIYKRRRRLYLSRLRNRHSIDI